MSSLDVQIGGDHYKKAAIQPVQYTVANCMAPCEMNIIKYISRYKDKNGVEDLRKVRHYIDLHLDTIHTEPEVFRALRTWMADQGVWGITPTEYIRANRIADERVQAVIQLVSCWRATSADIHVVELVIKNVELLIEEEERRVRPQ